MSYLASPEALATGIDSQAIGRGRRLDTVSAMHGEPAVPAVMRCPPPNLVSRNCVGVASGTGAETVIPNLDLESVGKMAARSVSVARGRLDGIRGRRKARLSLHAQGGSATGAMRWVDKGRKQPCT